MRLCCSFSEILIKSSAPVVKSSFEDDFEFVGRGPKYLDSPFDNSEASLFNKDDKDNSPSFTSRQFGKDDRANFHSSKVRETVAFPSVDMYEIYIDYIEVC